MKKQWLQKGLATAFAVVLAVGSVAVWPQAGWVAEASDTSFNQDIIVVNKSNADDVAGVRVPDMVVSYKLEPDIYTASGNMDNRYVTDLADYPKRTTNVVDASTPTIMVYNDLVSAYTSETGTDSVPIEVKKETFFMDGGNPLAFSGAGIYRYQLKMIGIYADGETIANYGTDADAYYKPISTWSANAKNMIDGNSLVEKPGRTILICDVSVDKDGNINAIAVWNADGTDKVTGFVGKADGGIQYNVYNVEVSSDYVGNQDDAGRTATALSYTVSFENLPNYLIEQGTATAVDQTDFDVSSRNLCTFASNKYTKQNTADLTGASVNYFVIPRPVKLDTGDPATLGYYETADGVEFTATADTGPVANKDYYKFSAAADFTTATLKDSINPKAEGWVVETSAGSGQYVLTTDTGIQNGTAYFTYAGGTNHLKLVTDGDSRFDAASVVGQLTVYKGSMAPNGTAIFIGVPYDDQALLAYTTAPTGVVTYGTALNYAGLNNSSYDTAIFSGSDKARITGISDFTAFKDAGYASEYSLKGNDNGVSTIAAKAMTTGTTEKDNNARYVLFNPEGLVLVGVVMNYAPAVIMIGVALAGVAMMFRRRREY